MLGYWGFGIRTSTYLFCRGCNSTQNSSHTDLGSNPDPTIYWVWSWPSYSALWASVSSSPKSGLHYSLPYGLAIRIKGDTVGQVSGKWGERRAFSWMYHSLCILNRHPCCCSCRIWQMCLQPCRMHWVPSWITTTVFAIDNYLWPFESSFGNMVIDEKVLTLPWGRAQIVRMSYSNLTTISSWAPQAEGEQKKKLGGISCMSRYFVIPAQHGWRDWEVHSELNRKGRGRKKGMIWKKAMTFWVLKAPGINTKWLDAQTQFGFLIKSKPGVIIMVL